MLAEPAIPQAAAVGQLCQACGSARVALIPPGPVGQADLGLELACHPLQSKSHGQAQSHGVGKQILLTIMTYTDGGEEANHSIYYTDN